MPALNSQRLHRSVREFILQWLVEPLPREEGPRKQKTPPSPPSAGHSVWVPVSSYDPAVPLLRLPLVRDSAMHTISTKDAGPSRDTAAQLLAGEPCYKPSAMCAEDKTYFPKGSDNATPHSYQKNKVKLYMLI